MNDKKIISLSLAALVVAVTSQFVMNEVETTTETNPSASAAPMPAATQAQASFPTASDIKPAVMSADEVFISEGVKQQMADIAASFEETIRYPTYSTPLSSTDWVQLNPRAFVSKAVPLDFDESVSAELVLDKYIVQADEALPVALKIHGSGQDRYGESLDVLSASIVVEHQGKTYSLGELYESDDSAYVSTNTDDAGQIYSRTVPSQKVSSLPSGEVLLSADITFSNHEQARVSAAIKVVDTVATVTGVGEAYVEGAHLMIPVSIDAKERGFYSLQANLFDESGEQPVSHLNSSFMLDGSESEALVKVHASTLRAKQAPGPYLMKDINLTRGPARPGDKTAYGSSAKESFRVSGYDLEVYSQEEYVDPKAQQRLEFLQKMAGIN